MDRGYNFSPDLLRLMLSEENQKFVTALGKGASWRELNKIRQHISELNKLLDAASGTRSNIESKGRDESPGPR